MIGATEKTNKPPFLLLQPLYIVNMKKQRSYLITTLKHLILLFTAIIVQTQEKNSKGGIEQCSTNYPWYGTFGLDKPGNKKQILFLSRCFVILIQTTVT